MNRRRILLAVLACASLAPVAIGAQDLPRDDKKERKKRAQREALEALRRGEILPLARILEIATREVPGDVIEVEFKGGPVYEIKVLTPAGRIREVKLDARSGDLLSVKDD